MGAAALVAVASGVVAWMIADRVRLSFAVPQPPRPDDIEIVAVEGDVLRYRDTRPDVGPADVGRLALRLSGGGWMYLADEVSTQGGGSARRIERVEGALPQPGELAQLDLSYFPADPRRGLGLEYEQVRFPGPLGDYPAWYVPGANTTWMIYTHGRGSTMREGLRAVEVAHRAGHPALVISYRNDEGAPRGDGVAKFGVDEWEDLEAAIAYARSRGATGVVLGAGSMGGAIVLALFEHGSAQVQAVRGVFLDSPALAIGRQSRLASEAMGVPGPLAELGFALAAWRFGLDWEAMDYLSAVEHVTVPLLVLHGADDRTIFVEANRPVFEALTRGGRATVEIVPGAQHLGIWNRDRAGFERRVAQFLGGLADAAGPAAPAAAEAPALPTATAPAAAAAPAETPVYVTLGRAGWPNSPIRKPAPHVLHGHAWGWLTGDGVNEACATRACTPAELMADLHEARPAGAVELLRGLKLAVGEAAFTTPEKIAGWPLATPTGPIWLIGPNGPCAAAVGRPIVGSNDVGGERDPEDGPPQLADESVAVELGWELTGCAVAEPEAWAPIGLRAAAVEPTLRWQPAQAIARQRVDPAAWTGVLAAEVARQVDEATAEARAQGVAPAVAPEWWLWTIGLADADVREYYLAGVWRDPERSPPKSLDEYECSDTELGVVLQARVDAAGVRELARGSHGALMGALVSDGRVRYLVWDNAPTLEVGRVEARGLAVTTLSTGAYCAEAFDE